jgi:hypothetical protein
VKDGNEPEPASTERSRRLAAKNELLAASESTKLAAATSPHTPSDILAVLSEDGSDAVKLAVGRNRNTPHHIVARLANHGSALVRTGLAADASTPLEILNVLAEDCDEIVRASAKQSRRILVAAIQAETTTDSKKERPLGSLSPRWA